MGAQGHAPDARGERGRTQQRPHALARPAIGRELVEMLEERMSHKNVKRKT
jgi:hypothetical protein